MKLHCNNCVQADERYETLRAAAQRMVDNGPCSDPDCCETAIDNDAARTDLKKVLVNG